MYSGGVIGPEASESIIAYDGKKLVSVRLFPLVITNGLYGIHLTSIDRTVYKVYMAAYWFQIFSCGTSAVLPYGANPFKVKKKLLPAVDSFARYAGK